MMRHQLVVNHQLVEFETQDRPYGFNMAWVCRSCGETFAERRVADATCGKRSWIAKLGVCRKCTDTAWEHDLYFSFSVPGDLSDNFIPPTPLLAADFLHLVQFIEKEIAQCLK